MFTRYAKPCNHLSMAYQATGNAMNDAIITSFKKSFEISATIPGTLAPNTFLTPISFTRCEMAKAERPNKPRHAMNMAMDAKTIKIVSCVCSDAYNFEKFSSKKVY